MDWYMKILFLSPMSSLFSTNRLIIFQVKDCRLFDAQPSPLTENNTAPQEQNQLKFDKKIAKFAFKKCILNYILLNVDHAVEATTFKLSNCRSWHQGEKPPADGLEISSKLECFIQIFVSYIIISNNQSFNGWHHSKLMTKFPKKYCGISLIHNWSSKNW